MENYKEHKLNSVEEDDDEILDYVLTEGEGVKESHKFNKDKKYIFDLETAFKDSWTKKLYKTGYNTHLMNCCNGKEVVIIGEYTGRVDFAESSYIVSPRSCKEIE
jgi:hypothetical protein